MFVTTHGVVRVRERLENIYLELMRKLIWKVL